MGGHDSTAEELLSRRADASTTHENGQTLLHVAVESWSLQMGTLLLNSGAVMSAQDPGGRTVLHLAAERGNQKMIKLLTDDEPSTSYVLEDRLILLEE